MANSRKWSEQCLVENTFGYKEENGNEVTNKLNCLNVCLMGKELYKKEFIEGKYKGKDMLGMSYDFIVEAGDMCSKGRFYEVEYTIGQGYIYRALIQVVNPVTDLPLIIGVLKKKNILPSNFKAHRAWLREDIGCVCIGNCSRDEDGEVSFYSSHNEARNCDTSVLDYAVKNNSCCIYYYRGDMHEVWIPKECDCSKEKVFVCGISGNDPDFAEERERALEEMWANLSEATQIACDYGISFFSAFQTDEGYNIDSNRMPFEVMDRILDAMRK